MNTDPRHIENGHEIPSEGYCDQPYVVVNEDGSWTCVMTTGAGHEGAGGQHVVSWVSCDQGCTWEGPFDIEPATGPEASWVMPLRVPETGRIYAFYTYNRDNQREVKTVSGESIARVDSLGVYAYRYSDDCGRTWSTERFEIPMRLFACDRENTYGGAVQFFWGVGKPFIHNHAAYVVASKVGGFGRGFFEQNEGVLFCSDNLLSEHDPHKHRWETLPDGEVGVRTPPGGGPIAGEFNVTPMNDGGLYGTYRTVDGFSCHAWSRDDGHTWARETMTYTPGGRRVKNPRGPNFVRRFSNGKYLYWFYFNGGEALGNHPDVASWMGYEHRNPAWLCGGVEKDGRIHWSQPEIAVYDPQIDQRMGYPDFIEQDGDVYVMETQKTIARVHRLDPRLLDALWEWPEKTQLVTEGLAVDLPAASCANGTTINMMTCGLQNRDSAGSRFAPGFSLELWVRFDDLASGQSLFDSRSASGGLLIETMDNGAVALHLPTSPDVEDASANILECDAGLLHAGALHQILFLFDGGPGIVSVMIDGELCDGGKERLFGWMRFSSALSDLVGTGDACLGASLHGQLEGLRVYDRCLFANEGASNCRSATVS